MTAAAANRPDDHSVRIALLENEAGEATAKLVPIVPQYGQLKSLDCQANYLQINFQSNQSSTKFFEFLTSVNRPQLSKGPFKVSIVDSSGKTVQEEPETPKRTVLSSNAQNQPSAPAYNTKRTKVDTEKENDVDAIFDVSANGSVRPNSVEELDFYDDPSNSKNAADSGALNGPEVGETEPKNGVATHGEAG